MTAARMLAAMRKADAGFTDRAAALACLMRVGDDPKALLSAASDVGRRDTALAIVAACYTGTVGQGPGAVVVSYADALMYRPVSDGLTVPTYCSNGPQWWTAPPPPALSFDPDSPGAQRAAVEWSPDLPRQQRWALARRGRI